MPRTPGSFCRKHGRSTARLTVLKTTCCLSFQSVSVTFVPVVMALAGARTHEDALFILVVLSREELYFLFQYEILEILPFGIT